MKGKLLCCLVFIGYCMTNYDNVVLSAGWLSPVQLTHNSTADQVPVINAQGTAIAYYGNEDGDDDIYVMVFQNGSWQQPQKLTFNSTPDTMPSINDNGDVIVYIGGGPGERRIYFTEYHEEAWKEPLKISTGPFNDYFPSSNADGTRIVFQSKDEQGHRFIRFVERNGSTWGEPVTLPAPTTNNMFPVINADGTRVGFYGEGGGYRHIYYAEYTDAAWSAPLKLTEGEEHNLQPSINARGTGIVYYSTGRDFLPHVQPGATAEIKMVEYRQGSWQLPVTIADSPLYEFDPTISGEGNRITYSASNPGYPETIYVVEFENGNWLPAENLTENVISGYRPYINRAGDRIVCYGTRAMDSDYEIYLLSYDPTAGTISGAVTISPGGEPCESALLYAEPGGYIALTDARGYYHLRVPAGNYTVTANADCFNAPAPVQVTVAAGETADLNISLIAGNCPPQAPVNPSPAQGSSNQAVITMLQWECSDPDQDPLTYDVLMGTETEHHIQLETVASHQTHAFYETEPLKLSTTYYWQIIARDNQGNERSGPLWHFTTVDCLFSLFARGDDQALAELRHFRDRVLSKTPEGREIIRLYYSLSPLLVRAMGCLRERP